MLLLIWFNILFESHKQVSSIWTKHLMTQNSGEILLLFWDGFY